MPPTPFVSKRQRTSYVALARQMSVFVSATGLGLGAPHAKRSRSLPEKARGSTLSTPGACVNRQSALDIYTPKPSR